MILISVPGYVTTTTKSRADSLGASRVGCGRNNCSFRAYRVACWSSDNCLWAFANTGLVRGTNVGGGECLAAGSCLVVGLHCSWVNGSDDSANSWVCLGWETSRDPCCGLCRITGASVGAWFGNRGRFLCDRSNGNVDSFGSEVCGGCVTNTWSCVVWSRASSLCRRRWISACWVAVGTTWQSQCERSRCQKTNNDSGEHLEGYRKNDWSSVSNSWQRKSGKKC